MFLVLCRELRWPFEISNLRRYLHRRTGNIEVLDSTNAARAVFERAPETFAAVPDGRYETHSRDRDTSISGFFGVYHLTLKV
jgi:hypothetical protein